MRGMLFEPNWLAVATLADLDVGTPVVSLVFPVGHITTEIRAPDSLVDQIEGRMGFAVKATLIGTSTDNVAMNVYPRDLPTRTFPVSVAAWGKTYANDSNPYNWIAMIPVELVGLAASVEFVRAANTGNLTVSASIRRYYYT